jgi:hypothetical protein
VTDWPQLPGAGAFVELPLPLPDGYQQVLLAAIGYTGDARHVGLRWTIDHQRVDWFDSELGLTGDPGPWRAFAEHPKTARVLEPYERAREQGDHLALLVDRWERSLLVGQTDEVWALVHSQPSALKADAIARGGTDGDMVDAILARLLDRRRDDAEYARARDIRAEFGAELVRWLDSAPVDDAS